MVAAGEVISSWGHAWRLFHHADWLIFLLLVRPKLLGLLLFSELLVLLESHHFSEVDHKFRVFDIFDIEDFLALALNLDFFLIIDDHLPKLVFSSHLLVFNWLVDIVAHTVVTLLIRDSLHLHHCHHGGYLSLKTWRPPVHGECNLSVSSGSANKDLQYCPAPASFWRVTFPSWSPAWVASCGGRRWWDNSQWG